MTAHPNQSQPNPGLWVVTHFPHPSCTLYLETGRVREVGLRTLRVVEGAVADGAPRRPEGEAAAVEEIPAPVPVFGRLIHYLW